MRILRLYLFKLYVLLYSVCMGVTISTEKTNKRKHLSSFVYVDSDEAISPSLLNEKDPFGLNIDRQLFSMSKFELSYPFSRPDPSLAPSFRGSNHPTVAVTTLPTSAPYFVRPRTTVPTRHPYPTLHPSIQRTHDNIASTRDTTRVPTSMGNHTGAELNVPLPGNSTFPPAHNSTTNELLHQHESPTSYPTKESRPSSYNGNQTNTEENDTSPNEDKFPSSKNSTLDGSDRNNIAGLGKGDSSANNSSLRTPYIISATVASAVGFLSATALFLSRRNRFELLLFPDEMRGHEGGHEEDSLEEAPSIA